MSWLKNADDLGGFPDDRSLPTPAMPSPGKPPAPAGPEMGKKPGMPPGAPGAPDAGGDPKNKVKSLLDKGDLEGALRELQKLVGPSGGAGKGGPSGMKPKAPSLGTPPQPKEISDHSDPFSSDNAGRAPAPREAGLNLQCGECGVLLEVDASLFKE